MRQRVLLLRFYIGNIYGDWSIRQMNLSYTIRDKQDEGDNHFGVSEYSWYSQLSRDRKFSTGTLSSTLLEPFKNFRIRLSRQNSKRVHISLTLPWLNAKEAFSLPYLQIAKPVPVTTAICSSHPPKKEFFLTFPMILAYLVIFSLTAALIRVGYTVFLPMIWSFWPMILAKTKQYWSRRCPSFIFLGFAARKTSYFPTVSLILKEPVGVGCQKIIFALVMSQRGSVLSPKAIEFSRNQSTRSLQMLLPLLEGTSTSCLSLAVSFRSFSFTVASRPAPWASFCYFEGFRSKATKPNPVSSSLKALLGEVSILTGVCLALGWRGTSSSEEELLPNSIFLFLSASCLRAILSILYFSLSALNKLSCSGRGDPREESVLSASATKFSLRGTGFLGASSFSEEEERPKACLLAFFASFWRALRQARYCARCFLNSSSAAEGGGMSSAVKRLRFQVITSALGLNIIIMNQMQVQTHPPLPLPSTAHRIDSKRISSLQLNTYN